MNETAPRLDEAPYIHRPALEAAVVTAAAGRKRLILVGAVGSGRSTLLLRALGKARFKVHFVEMMGVLTKNGLAAAFQAHGVRRSARKAVPDIPMPQALRLLDEKALRHRHALILNNLDGCSPRSGCRDRDRPAARTDCC